MITKKENRYYVSQDIVAKLFNLTVPKHMSIEIRYEYSIGNVFDITDCIDEEKPNWYDNIVPLDALIETTSNTLLRAKSRIEEVFPNYKSNMLARVWITDNSDLCVTSYLPLGPEHIKILDDYLSKEQHDRRTTSS